MIRTDGTIAIAADSVHLRREAISPTSMTTANVATSELIGLMNESGVTPPMTTAANSNGGNRNDDGRIRRCVSASTAKGRRAIEANKAGHRGGQSAWRCAVAPIRIASGMATETSVIHWGQSASTSPAY